MRASRLLILLLLVLVQGIVKVQAQAPCIIAQPGDLIALKGIPEQFSTYYSYSTLMGGHVDTAAWWVNGSLVSTQLNPSLTFPNTGFYKLHLMVGNKGYATGSIWCSDTMTFPIKVVCPIQAQFNHSPSVVIPGSTVTFTQASAGSSSYQWLLDGHVAATGPTWTTSFIGPGAREVCLVTSDGAGCKDTLCKVIPVGDCGHSRNRFWQIFDFQGGMFQPNGSWTNNINSVGYGWGSSICDKQGNLVIYNDESKVYRSATWPTITGNTPDYSAPACPNGSGIFGGEGYQKSIIVPNPGDDSLYHLFTANGGTGTNPGIYRSNFDLRQGPIGDITLKNQRFIPKGAGTLTAVHHANGCDFWLLAHPTERDCTDFRAYRVTAAGLDTVPVVTKIGSPHFTGSGGAIASFTKISPLGTHVAAIYSSQSRLEIFSFSKITGKLGTPISIQLPTDGQLWGMEFSPDGSKIYLTWLRPGSNGIRARGILYQVDLNAGNPAAIRASLRLVYLHPHSNAHVPFILTRTPYGHIYMGLNYGGFRVILTPNQSGAECAPYGYGPYFWYFFIGQAPNHVVDFGVNFRQRIRGPKTLCVGAQQQYYFDMFNCGDSVAWSFSPGIVQQASAHGTVWLSFPTAGQHAIYAEAFTECGHYLDTLRVTVGGNGPSLSLGADRLFCPGQPVTGTLNAGPGMSSYY